MKKIERVLIVDIPSPGQLGAVFSDLIVALTHTLTSMGIRVDYSRRLQSTTDPVIVFGLYRLFIKQSLNKDLPRNYFIFNLAPIFQGQLEWFDNYVRYLARQPSSIDYAHFNADQLDDARSVAGGTHIFEFGYFNLFPYAGFRPGENFVFYGSLNPERTQRLAAFKQAGVKVEVLQNVWGLERDMQIRCAKGVLNIGKYKPNILEVYRLWHTLCLGAPVFSDAGIDARLVTAHARYARIFSRLEPAHLAMEPVSPALYQAETSFSRSVQALLAFMAERAGPVSGPA